MLFQKNSDILNAKYGLELALQALGYAVKLTHLHVRYVQLSRIVLLGSNLQKSLASLI